MEIKYRSEDVDLILTEIQEHLKDIPGELKVSHVEEISYEICRMKKMLPHVDPSSKKNIQRVISEAEKILLRRFKGFVRKSELKELGEVKKIVIPLLNSDNKEMFRSAIFKMENKFIRAKFSN